MGREIPKLRVLTKEELLNVRNGDILYDHTGGRWKITSVKTWITRPDDRDIGLKHGMYDFGRASIRGGKVSGTELFGGPDTDIDTKDRTIPGMPKVGQTVELVKPFQEKLNNPEYEKPELPVGTVGVVKDVRPLEERFREYHDGALASMQVSFKGHYTSYNVPSTFVKVRVRKATAKPRLSR